MPLGRMDRYQEVLLTSSEGVWTHSTSTSGKKAAYAPGFQPIKVMAFAVQNLTTFAYTTSQTVTFWLNTAPGLTATGNYTAIDTITLTTGASADIGQVFYATPAATAVKVGEEVVMEVTFPTTTATSASESHRVRALMFIEGGWQVPSENSNMTLSV